MMESAKLSRFMLQFSFSSNYHFWSRSAAVDHFAAVHSQGDRDGNQSDVNNHTFSIKVRLGTLKVGVIVESIRLNQEKNENKSMYKAKIFNTYLI